MRLPILPADTRFGFYEFNRRAGDFALGMALVTYRLQDGMIASRAWRRRCRAAAAPDRGGRAGARRPSAGQQAFAAAADAAMAAVDPLEDVTTSADYRRDLTRTVTRRALEQAAA